MKSSYFKTLREIVRIAKWTFTMLLYPFPEKTCVKDQKLSPTSIKLTKTHKAKKNIILN